MKQGEDGTLEELEDVFKVDVDWDEGGGIGGWNVREEAIRSER